MRKKIKEKKQKFKYTKGVSINGFWVIEWK